MGSVMLNWKNDRGLPLLEDMTWWVIGHPFEFAQTLAKMGYEPHLPVAESFFGTECYALPNIINYVKYIGSVDGLAGCYRGLAPTLCHRVVQSIVQKQIDEHCPWTAIDPFDKSKVKKFLRMKSNESDPVKWQETFKIAGWRMFSVTIGTVVSHPFYLISIKMMAQFVGRETKFETIIASFKTVVGEEGFLGLFKGLLPRLLAENLKILIPATVLAFFSTAMNNRPATNIIVSGTKFLAERFVHQLEVVSSTMIVQNSGLALGNFPFVRKAMPSSLDCWKNLYELNNHHRGRNWVFRYYNGPMAPNAKGELVPSGVYFGPDLLLPGNKKPQMINLGTLENSAKASWQRTSGKKSGNTKPNN